MMCEFHPHAEATHIINDEVDEYVHYYCSYCYRYFKNNKL
jgi:hypothetical protein